MRKTIIAALLLATACTQTYIPPKPDIDFSGTPYLLNVANITVVNEYISSGQLPNVEKLADITPTDLITKWEGSKLVAAGHSGYAELVIKDAHIRKHDLGKKKTGVEGYFAKEQTEEYDGGLEVELKIYDGKKTMPVASLNAAAKNSRTLREDANIIDHNTLYHEMSVELLKLIEPELDRNIHEHFGRFLVN